MPRRAVTYRRVSTGKQAREGLSLPEQRKRMLAEVEHRGWELVHEFEDGGRSAKAGDRLPDRERLMDAAERGEFEVLVIPRLDRFGRSTRELLELCEQLRAAGVELVSMAESIDTGTPTGRLLLTVLAAIAEFENDVRAERVAEVTEARATSGKAPGGRFPPTGYRRRDKKYVIHEPEAQVIRRIFTDADEGYSQHRIAQCLNDERILTSSGKAWNQGSIGRILRHPVYRGAMQHKGQVVAEDAHPAIIEPALWHRVQRVMAARDNAPGAARGRKPNSSHLLIGGMLRCSCGYSMSPRSRTRSRPNATDTYECNGRRDHGTDFCPQRPIPREPIDRAILEQFKLIGLDMEATEREYAEATAHQLQQARDALAQAERAEQHAAEAVERIQRDYARGALSAESFEGLRPQYVAEHEGAAAEVERLRAHEHAIANATALDDAEEAVLRWLAELREVIAGKVRNAESVEALRNALTRLFECFELNPDPKASMQIVPVLCEDALVSDDPVLDADTPAMYLTGIRVPQVTRTG